MPEWARDLTLAAVAAAFITFALTLTAEPNPYSRRQLGAPHCGRTMGSLSAVGIDPKGNVWVAAAAL